MTKQLSFSKIENDLLPGFRKKIGDAESTEDVKKFYVYTMQGLIQKAFAGSVAVEYEDFSLLPDEDPPYAFNDRLLAIADFSSVWNSSDLPHVVSRFTETAVKRFKHLEKNPQKTESKIRM